MTGTIGEEEGCGEFITENTAFTEQGRLIPTCLPRACRSPGDEAGTIDDVKRWVLTIILFLLLGAVTTVSLSWAFALLGSVTSEEFVRANGVDWAHFAWPVGVPDDWPAQSNGMRRMRGRGVFIDDAFAVVQPRQHFKLLSIRLGWPLPAMHYRWQSVENGMDVTHALSPSITVPAWLQRYVEGFKTRFPAMRRLPVVPLWWGFLLNTSLYALGFWVLLRVRRTIRAHLRARRHQCIACGYPIGESTFCTECGAAVN